MSMLTNDPSLWERYLVSDDSDGQSDDESYQEEQRQMNLDEPALIPAPSPTAGSFQHVPTPEHSISLNTSQDEEMPCLDTTWESLDHENEISALDEETQLLKQLLEPDPHNILGDDEVDFRHEEDPEERCCPFFWSWMFETFIASWLIVYWDDSHIFATIASADISKIGETIDEKKKKFQKEMDNPTCFDETKMKKFQNDMGFPSWLRFGSDRSRMMKRIKTTGREAMLESGSDPKEGDINIKVSAAVPNRTIFNLCCCTESEDQDSITIQLRTSNADRKILKRKTCLNVLIFCINLYTLFFHTIFTEPKTTGPKNVDCQVIFNENPNIFTLEFMLLLVYIIIPIMISYWLKFVWENDSFVVLKTWDDLIDNRSASVSRTVKKTIKSKVRRSFLFGVLWFSLSLIAYISGIIFHCPSDRKVYTMVLFLFVVCFITSGMFALLASYNIIRMYTSFIRTSTAVFQAELKKNLSAFDKAVNAADEDAELRFPTDEDALLKRIRLRSKSSENATVPVTVPDFKDDCYVVNMKKRDSLLTVCRSVAKSHLDKNMKVRHKYAMTMFKRMSVVNKKVEGPVTCALRCLFVAGLAVLVYIGYYSLFFVQDVMPYLDLRTSMPSVSSFPSQTPSFRPSVSTSPSQAPSFQPSVSTSPSQVPTFQPSVSTSPSQAISTSPSSSFQPSISTSPSSIPSTSTSPSSGTISPSYMPAEYSGGHPTPDRVGIVEGGPDSDSPNEFSFYAFLKKVPLWFEKFLDMPPHLRHSMLFFLALLTIILFNIVYTWKLLMLFAKQVDSWDQLIAFCETRMSLEGDNNSYGSEFEKLGRFIKSSTNAFGWMFLVKGQCDTAVQYVTKKVQRQLFVSALTIIIAQVFRHVPEMIGLDDSASNQAWLKLGEEWVKTTTKTTND